MIYIGALVIFFGVLLTLVGPVLLFVATRFEAANNGIKRLSLIQFIGGAAALFTIVVLSKIMDTAYFDASRYLSDPTMLAIASGIEIIGLLAVLGLFFATAYKIDKLSKAQKEAMNNERH